MSANQAGFPIAAMARVLGVSEAGFHAWRHRVCRRSCKRTAGGMAASASRG